MEQERFETPLYQVTLQLKTSDIEGGGMEQKLNRIRAIKGVTVVSHEESSDLMGADIIDAKIKFHPESDAMRPGTYVTQVLIPIINNSRAVPGTKVINVMKGSMKRLDK